MRKIDAHIDKHWTMYDLPDFGFEPFRYYKFKSKFWEWWYNIFGDRVFKVDREFMHSDFRMDKDNYFISCDEMGYVDVYYKDSKYGDKCTLINSGRREITLSNILNSIKEHRRKLNLKEFFEDEDEDEDEDR